MKARNNHGRRWLVIGLCFTLMFPLATGVAEAKAKKDKVEGKCQGTKKQRKQKMPDREISDEQLAEMIEEYKKENLADREIMKQTVARRFEREYEELQATGKPFVYDILVISGGGAKGAFGAGFLEGWGMVKSDEYARPEFDAVTGVSTGALIAPFAFIGTDEAYASAVEFYSNPKANWVKSRGAIKFLPSHISMYNTCHLQDTIRSGVDEAVVEGMAESANEDQLLLIGTTNLDVGVGRAFDMGREAQEALESGDFHRVHSILLASSAIPGAFPPIEIDKMLYADGGATSNLFITTFPGNDGPLVRFRATHREAPFPKIRLWVVVNQQLKPQHAVTQPKWISISGRALGTLTATSQLFALALVKELADNAVATHGVDSEVRFISIPIDAPKNETKDMFNKEYMLALADLGRKMGADPSTWQTTIPSAFRVESEWMRTD
jgi:predicted acylesterase/phospholipase RssA